jgi:hypothetical protein
MPQADHVAGAPASAPPALPDAGAHNALRLPTAHFACRLKLRMSGDGRAQAIP